MCSSDLARSRNKGYRFNAPLTYPGTTTGRNPPVLANGALHLALINHRFQQTSPYTGKLHAADVESLSRDDAVGLGSARVSRAVDGVAPSTSSPHSIPLSGDSVCETKFAARRRKSHAGGVCSPFSTAWVRLNAKARRLEVVSKIEIKLRSSGRG